MTLVICDLDDPFRSPVHEILSSSAWLELFFLLVLWAGKQARGGKILGFISGYNHVIVSFFCW